MSGLTARAWKEVNDPVIAEFRANAGYVVGRRWPVLLLTTIGARSGLQRVTPLVFGADGDRLVVIASKRGSATHPGWYMNLIANPEVTVEIGSETFRARAVPVTEPERSRLFDRLAAEMPFFEEYRLKARRRVIPVVILERIDG